MNLFSSDSGPQLEEEIRTLDNFCNINYLLKEDFLEVIRKFPIDNEKYCRLKDNVTIYKKYSEISHSCYSCERI